MVSHSDKFATMRASRRKISIKMKIAGLLAGVLLFSMLCYTAISMFGFKEDKFKYILDANHSYTTSLAEKVETGLSQAISLMQNIILVVHMKATDADKTNFMTRLFQK